MSLTCKQMLIANDLFYKRSSLWWFLYEHISGLSSALLNHLHKGNWSREYYSHVRPHHSVRKARSIIELGVHLNATAHVCRAIQNFTTSCQLFHILRSTSLLLTERKMVLMSRYSCLCRTSQLTLAATLAVIFSELLDTGSVCNHTTEQC